VEKTPVPPLQLEKSWSATGPADWNRFILTAAGRPSHSGFLWMWFGFRAGPDKASRWAHSRQCSPSGRLLRRGRH